MQILSMKGSIYMKIISRVVFHFLPIQGKDRGFMQYTMSDVTATFHVG
jgi:hypothetical protein